MMRVQSAEELINEGLALARADSLLAMLYVLERGESLMNVGGFAWLGALGNENKDRIRKLRERLIERDLYEAIYGPLPARCCDAESRATPDFDAAQEAFVNMMSELPHVPTAAPALPPGPGSE